MNEQSITSLGPTGLRSLPEKVKRGIKRFFGFRAGWGHAKRPPKAAPEVSPELRSRASEAIREFVGENEALFARASRFEERARRLRSEGMPSESALNRAERARHEILAGLGALRESLVASEGEEAGLAFDAEVEKLYPGLVPPGDG